MAKKKTKKRKSTAKKKTKKAKKSARPQINLSDAERVYIVSSLVHNDEFRKRIRSAPVSALKELGIKVRASDLPDEISLPSKRELRRKLTEYLESPTTCRVPYIIRWPIRCDE